MSGGAPDVVLAERTGASCAVASWQGRLHLAWTGSNMRLNTISSSDGRHFEGKRTLSHRSYKTVTRSSRSSSGSSLSDTTTEYVPLAPALAATASGLVLAWTATDRRLNVSGPGMGDAGYLELGETSSNPPALGAAGHDLMLAWTGTDSHLNLLHVRAGAWSRPWRLDETSSCPPAVCMAGKDQKRWCSPGRAPIVTSTCCRPGMACGVSPGGSTRRAASHRPSAPSVTVSSWGGRAAIGTSTSSPINGVVRPHRSAWTPPARAARPSAHTSMRSSWRGPAPTAGRTFSTATAGLGRVATENTTHDSPIGVASRSIWHVCGTSRVADTPDHHGGRRRGACAGGDLVAGVRHDLL